MLVLGEVAALEVHQGSVWRVLDKPLATVLEVWGAVALCGEVRGQVVQEQVGQGARVGPRDRARAVLAVGPGGRARAVLEDQEQVGQAALVPTLAAPGLTRKPA